MEGEQKSRPKGNPWADIAEEYRVAMEESKECFEIAKMLEGAARREAMTDAIQGAATTMESMIRAYRLYNQRRKIADEMMASCAQIQMLVEAVKEVNNRAGEK